MWYSINPAVVQLFFFLKIYMSIHSLSFNHLTHLFIERDVDPLNKAKTIERSTASLTKKGHPKSRYLFNKTRTTERATASLTADQ